MDQESLTQPAQPVQPQPQPIPPITPTPTDQISINPELQKELSKWNWGAFLLTWIWGVSHKVWWSLLALIPIGIFQLVVAIILGVKGNELAWKNNHYNSLEDFKTVQKKWANAGLIVFVITFVFTIIIFGLMVKVALGGAQEKAKDARIKGDIAQTRNVAEQYYSTHNGTYVGFTGDPTINQDIQDQGSMVKIQGTSTGTYVIYAQLPNAKTIWCADATGVSKEVNSISPTQTACK